MLWSGLVLAIVGMMVAAGGALIGMEIAAVFGLPTNVCTPLGAAMALLGAIALERRETRAARPRRKP